LISCGDGRIRMRWGVDSDDMTEGCFVGFDDDD